MYARMHEKKDGRSDIRIAEIEFLLNGKNFVFENASPYVEKFNRIIRTMLESGIMEKWKRTTKRKITSVGRNANTKWIIIEFFTILAIGYGTSVVVFSFEFVYDYFKGSRSLIKF